METSSCKSQKHNKDLMTRNSKDQILLLGKNAYDVEDV